jgi:GntR family transcriptional regulator
MRRHVSTSIPAYLAIERALREDIAQMQPGDAIPTEAQLCERFGVSRMTARAGVARLVDAGLLFRTRGKGTFVAQPHVHRQAWRLRSFSQDMLARGLRPSSRILEITQEVAPPDVADALQLPHGARVILIRRERLADDRPMALERTLLPPVCAAVLGADLERGSLHQALAELGHVASVARGAIVPQPATQEDAATFDVPIGEPLLVETRLVYDAGDTPIERTESRYSPSRYILDIELHAAAD